MNVFEQKNAELVTEFDRYVREHPEFADRIPNNALVAMLVEGDPEFNRWSQEGAKRQAERTANCIRDDQEDSTDSLAHSRDRAQCVK